MDVYLTRLDPPAALCGFRFTAHANPALGVENYTVVARNRKTGKERVVRNDSTDRFASALYDDGKKKPAALLKEQLGVTLPE